MQQVSPSHGQSKSDLALFKAATFVHSGISVFNICQLLELWTLHEIFAKVVRACVSLHYVPGGSARLEPPTGRELGTVLLLKNIANEIGGDKILSAIEALEGSQSVEHFSLASGFGVRFLQPAQDVCISCGGLRYLRSACMSCGAPHLLECRLMRVDVSSPNKNYFRSDSTLDDARLKSISIGITYVNSCGSERNTFSKFGGDVVFLVRNLVHTVGLNGDVSRKKIEKIDLIARNDLRMSLAAAECLIDLVQRWMADHLRGSNEMEMEEILNIVEALHAIVQLGIDATSLPPAAEILAKLTTIEHPIVANATMVEKEDPRELKSRSITRNPGFSIGDIKRRLKDAILQFDVTDMLGYDPTKHQVPLTDSKHCAH
jgi:hypothetical protein